MVYLNDDPRALAFPPNWTGSAAHLNVASTAEIEWTIEYAGGVIGTITFTPGAQLDGDTGQYAAITGPGTDTTPIANLELLRIRAPDAADATAKFLTVALVGAYVEP